jgi:hypothetical protein
MIKLSGCLKAARGEERQDGTSRVAAADAQIVPFVLRE